MSGICSREQPSHQLRSEHTTSSDAGYAAGFQQAPRAALPQAVQIAAALR